MSEKEAAELRGYLVARGLSDEGAAGLLDIHAATWRRKIEKGTLTALDLVRLGERIERRAQRGSKPQVA